MFGLSFVVKLLDDDIFYETINLRSWAKEYISKMIHFVRDVPYAESGQLFSWIILGPDHKPVCQGPSGIFLSYPMARTGALYGSESTTYQNAISDGFGSLVWDEIALESDNHPEAGWSIGPTLAPYTSGLLYLTIHSNPWNNIIFLQLAAMSHTWHKLNLAKSAYVLHFGIFDLASAVLNDYNPVSGPMAGITKDNYYPVSEDVSLSYSQELWEEYLNQSLCTGPCYDDHVNYIGSGGYADYTQSDCPYSGHSGDCDDYNCWNFVNRWQSNEIPTTTGGYSSGFGEYNGLDYMIAYNLYLLAFHLVDNNKYLVLNAETRNLSATFPYNVNVAGGTVTVGNHSNVYWASSPDNLNIDVTLQSDADLIAIAPNVVLTNMSPTLGSDFYMGPGDFICNPNVYNEAGLTYVTYRERDSILNKVKVSDAIIGIKPVPSHGLFTISIVGIKNSVISIFDISGRLETEIQATDGDTGIDLSALPKGIYLILIFDKETGFRKTIKQVLE